ncbi:type II toxin-antitoxin system VapB family antitoxin [Algoriphagus litoralis]|uniref:type II toxin-antitoxin system VapB family antitoxin n=1 Tax=Algoriphagus litoralis TaxID=2202829 RepID=UPI000DB92CC7|nr:type II toxin-antitoxin system VapB family antitoxin [Algoriphagus litoralis]
MRTNIEINQNLIEEIMKMTSIKTKKEAVHLALEEFLRRLKLNELAGMAGEIEWEGDLEEMRIEK